MEGIVPDVTAGAALVERAVAGDRAAFARIVAAHHTDMIRVPREPKGHLIQGAATWSAQRWAGS
jgi:hypothetical protein